MGLDAAGREHHIRQLSGDRGGRSFGAQKTDIARTAVDRAVNRHHRRTWVLLGTGVDADHSAGVLVAAFVRIGPRAGQLLLVHALQVGCFVVISAQSDIDHGHLAAVRSAPAAGGGMA